MSNQLDFRLFYRRNLPHIQPPGATLFITTTLHGSLPAEVLNRLREEARRRLLTVEETAEESEKDQLYYLEERRYFGRFDETLDNADYGPDWIRDPRVAQVICDTIHGRDGQTYDLIAYCVMPNHLHIVLTPLQDTHRNYFSITRIMHALKGFSAYQANLILGRKGAFWQGESYDHYVRDDEELQRIVHYVLGNSVKAGLVDDWTKWPWTYWKYR